MPMPMPTPMPMPMPTPLPTPIPARRIDRFRTRVPALLALSCAALVAASLAACERPPDAPVPAVHLDGIGEARAGMTLGQLRAALPETLALGEPDPVFMVDWQGIPVLHGADTLYHVLLPASVPADDREFLVLAVTRHPGARVMSGGGSEGVAPGMTLSEVEARVGPLTLSWSVHDESREWVHWVGMPPGTSLRVDPASVPAAGNGLAGVYREVGEFNETPDYHGEARIGMVTVELARYPWLVLERAEAALLADTAWSLAFGVESEGAFAASLEGELHLRPGDTLELRARGIFGADSVDLRLDAGAAWMRWGSGRDASLSEVPRPAHLEEALVVGLTRMGILHNLARLVSGSPPDRADGGVREWVEAVNPTWTSTPPGEGIAFGIRVEGQDAGEAVLHLGPEGRPAGREQVVRFPGGEMRVRESYQWSGEPRSR